MKIVVLFGWLFVVAVQAKYEFSKNAKDCMKEIGTDEDTLEPLIVKETGLIDENNDLVKKFLGCCFKTYISDTNEIILNEKLTNYITEIFTTRFGKRKLARLMAIDCLKKCKDIKGNTKDLTAVKVTNCLMTKFYELKDDK